MSSRHFSGNSTVLLPRSGSFLLFCGLLVSFTVLLCPHLQKDREARISIQPAEDEDGENCLCVLSVSVPHIFSLVSECANPVFAFNWLSLNFTRLR